MKIHRVFLSLCAGTIWTFTAQGTEIIEQQNEKNQKYTNSFYFSRKDIDRFYEEYKSGKFKGADRNTAKMRISGHDDEDGDESKPQQKKNEK